MKAISCLIVLVGLFVATSLQAQTPFNFNSIDSPTIVQNGLDTYRTTGSKAALDVWLAKSALAASDVRTTLQNKFNDLETANGKMDRFEQIGTFALTQSVRIGWYTICYSKGVAFVEFTAYQGKSSWIITNIRVSTDYHDILPAYQFQLR